MNKIMDLSYKNPAFCARLSDLYPAVLLCNQMRANFQHGGQRRAERALSSSIVFSFFCAVFEKCYSESTRTGKNQRQRLLW